MRDLVSPVAVTAHDAGAANLIAGWLAECAGMEVRVAVGGPALAIFGRELPLMPAMPIDRALSGAAVLLSGTSGTSRMEHDARKLARAQSVPSIAVIDHWVNYPERFQRGDEVVLPDAIWVGDEYAETLARQHFPEVPVYLKANRYLDRQVADVAAAAVRHAGPTRILYVLEPIRTAWGRTGVPGEFQALDFFLEQLPRLGASADAEIRLRPHPEDPTGKYNQWVAGVHGHRVSLGTGGSLARAIAWADWVVGCETYAMVVALQAGRRVFSSLPSWAPPCRLPFPGIEHLRSLSE